MLLSGLLFGLLSSLHCLGMCGPIALMLPVSRENQTKKTLQIITYHLGRILAYSGLGLLFGILGSGFYLAGFQQHLSIVLGVLMIVFVVVPEHKIFTFYPLKGLVHFSQWVKQQLAFQFKRKTWDAFLAIGFANGLLPCGLVYVALFGALAMPTVGERVLFMTLFGLGTIPLMSIMVYIATHITQAVRHKMLKLIPVVVFIMGAWLIIRGLGLNIPYVSPDKLHLFIQFKSNCH